MSQLLGNGTVRPEFKLPSYSESPLKWTEFFESRYLVHKAWTIAMSLGFKPQADHATGVRCTFNQLNYCSTAYFVEVQLVGDDVTAFSLSFATH